MLALKCAATERLLADAERDNYSEVRWPEGQIAAIAVPPDAAS